MNTIPQFGQFIHGGHFHGAFLLDGTLWGEVTGPKAECEVAGIVWHPDYKDIKGAGSEWDGLANTIAMAKAGSPLAQAAVDCASGGFNDWYVPARGGQFMQWSNLAGLLADKKAEAFLKKAYWNSTQCSRHNAWYTTFSNGYTLFYSKDWSGAGARFVRRFLIE